MACFSILSDRSDSLKCLLISFIHFIISYRFHSDKQWFGTSATTARITKSNNILLALLMLHEMQFAMKLFFLMFLMEFSVNLSFNAKHYLQTRSIEINSPAWWPFILKWKFFKWQIDLIIIKMITEFIMWTLKVDMNSLQRCLSGGFSW